MRMRMLLALGIGALVGVLERQGPRSAQQNLKSVPPVISPNGSFVEEVRVGGSCVVIVSTTGSSPHQIAVTACR